MKRAGRRFTCSLRTNSLWPVSYFTVPIFLFCHSDSQSLYMVFFFLWCHPVSSITACWLAGWSINKKFLFLWLSKTHQQQMATCWCDRNRNVSLSLSSCWLGIKKLANSLGGGNAPSFLLLLLHGVVVTVDHHQNSPPTFAQSAALKYQKQQPSVLRGGPVSNNLWGPFHFFCPCGGSGGRRAGGIHPGDNRVTVAPRARLVGYIW